LVAGVVLVVMMFAMSPGGFAVQKSNPECAKADAGPNEAKGLKKECKPD